MELAAEALAEQRPDFGLELFPVSEQNFPHTLPQDGRVPVSLPFSAESLLSPSILSSTRSDPLSLLEDPSVDLFAPTREPSRDACPPPWPAELGPTTSLILRQDGFVMSESGPRPLYKTVSSSFEAIPPDDVGQYFVVTQAQDGSWSNPRQMALADLLSRAGPPQQRRTVAGKTGLGSHARAASWGGRSSQVSVKPLQRAYLRRSR
jgi:hypothetical protein